MQKFPGVNEANFNRIGLTAWVNEQDAGQLIRKTEKPYFDHLLFVGEKAGAIISFGFEIGICHDLSEKTLVTPSKLRAALLRFGYSFRVADYITNCVLELTEVFTKANFPDLKKKERKIRETKRLAKISPDAQSVKYADLIYNIIWMVNHEPKKLFKYLKRKKELLKAMHDGDANLRNEALALIELNLRDIKGSL